MNLDLEKAGIFSKSRFADAKKKCRFGNHELRGELRYGADTNSFPNRIYPCFNFARCAALTGPTHEKDFALSDKSLHWPIDFVVLPDLVSRGSGPLFRSKPAHLDDLSWFEFDHRNRALHQLDDQRKQTSALANYSAFYDAIFCFELCGAGERKKFCSDFFAGPKGDFRSADFVRNVLRIRVGIESFQTLAAATLEFRVPTFPQSEANPKFHRAGLEIPGCYAGAGVQAKRRLAAQFFQGAAT